MKMKNGLKDIVGKTIASVIVGNSDEPPYNQVMLVFSDGNYFEFYGENFTCSSELDKGGVKEASLYIEKSGGQVVCLFP